MEPHLTLLSRTVPSFFSVRFLEPRRVLRLLLFSVQLLEIRFLRKLSVEGCYFLPDEPKCFQFVFCNRFFDRRQKGAKLAIAVRSQERCSADNFAFDRVSFSFRAPIFGLFMGNRNVMAKPIPDAVAS